MTFYAVSPLSILQRATCMSIALKRDAERAVAEIMVVASACIIHKLIRGSLPRLAFAMLDGPVLLAIYAILHAS